MAFPYDKFILVIFLILVYHSLDWSDMMDTRPLGVFDSGLGGLSGFRHLAELMPDEDIIYLGDTGRVPYGTRSDETIIRYACEDAGFLIRKGVKAILVACNTVSATAMPTLRKMFDVPLFDVVSSAVKCSISSTKNLRIGVIGTEATVRSGIYGKRIRAEFPSIEVYETACPLLVPLVENGRIKRGDIVAETVVAEYLSEIKKHGVDTLILGCTHYRMMREIISDFIGEKVTLIDSGAVGAENMVRVLAQKGLRAEHSRLGQHSFFVTDSTQEFEHQASVFLGTNDKLHVSQTNLSEVY